MHNDESPGKYVKANGINIHYREYGSGTPAIMLHGSLDCTGAMWQPQVARMRDACRLIVPDLRGHGGTLNPAEKITLALLADDAAGFARALDLDRPVLCGLSMGGRAVLETAMRYPGMFRALIVCAAQVHGPFPPGMRDQMRRCGLRAPGDVDTALFEKTDPARVARLRQMHPGAPDRWAKLLRALSYAWPVEYHALEDYGKINAPTMLVVGDRDHAVRIEDVTDMYRALPDAELAVLPGHDHTSLIGRNNSPFVPLTLDFLARRGLMERSVL